MQFEMRNGLAPWPGMGWGGSGCSEVLRDPQQVGPTEMQVLGNGA